MLGEYHFLDIWRIIKIMALDLNTELLKFRRTKNQLAAEAVRMAMDPGSLILDLYGYREQLKIADPGTYPMLDRQIAVTLNLLKKCMPDLKAVEVKAAISVAEVKTFNDMYPDEDD